MRCARAQRILALRQSGDAGTREVASAAAHLERCGECRRVAEAAVLSLRAVRNKLPLQEADFLEIRASVMAKVRQNERRPVLFPLRIALAAAVVLLIALGTFIAVQRPLRTNDRRQAPVQAAKPIAPRAPAAAGTVAPAEPETAIASIQPKLSHVPHRVHQTHRRPEAIEASLRPQSAPVAQIEIQTADPDIRIIWIANPTLAMPGLVR